MYTDMFNCPIGKVFYISRIYLPEREKIYLHSFGVYKGCEIVVRVRDRSGVIMCSNGRRLAVSKKIGRRVILKECVRSR